MLRLDGCSATLQRCLDRLQVASTFRSLSTLNKRVVHRIEQFATVREHKSDGKQFDDGQNEDDHEKL